MLMDELQVDFAMKRGHEMIVDLKNGIKREQLDSIDIQMLQSQRIPKLLPVEWIDIDGGVSLRYPIGGKRMLMHRLQTQRLTMTEFYALLLAVVEALDDCRHYMLRSECFLLHEQYIFVGENWDEAMLAYVPLRDIRAVASAGEAVLAMAIRWVGGIDEPDGIGLQRVFQHLRGELVAWVRLRQTLLALLGASYQAGLEGNRLPEAADRAMIEFAGSNGQNGTPQQSEALKAASIRFDGLAAKAGKGDVPKNEGIRAGSSAEFHSAGASEAAKHSFESAAGIEREPFDAAWHGLDDRAAGRLRLAADDALPLTELSGQAAESSRTGWMIGAGWVLAAAIIWRFLYLSSPTQTNLLLCCGLTLMTGAMGLIVILRIRDRGAVAEACKDWGEQESDWSADDRFVPNSDRPGRGGSIVATSIQAVQQPNAAVSSRANQQPNAAVVSSRAVQQPNAAVVSSRAVQQPNAAVVSSGGLRVDDMRRAESIHGPMNQTAYKPQSGAGEATVLLGQAKEPFDETKRMPWLERQTEGNAEKIRLEQTQFVIGRSNDGVHYMDQASGISRAHLELSGSDGRWSAKDMGSRNGSTLNGSMMIPYKTYSLADTDKLQLAGDAGPVYIFRAG